MLEPRIAFFSEHASPIAGLGGVDAGGQNVYVDEVSRGLAGLGYGVDVFTRREEGRAPDVIEWRPGVRVINLSAGPARYVFKDDLWPFMPAFRDAFYRFLLADGAQYELIHGNFWMSGFVAADIANTLDLPFVQIFHATGLTKARHQGSEDTSPAQRIRIERAIVRHADALIAQCPQEEEELIHDYGADPGRVHLIPSAVDIHTFRPVDRLHARHYLHARDGLRFHLHDFVIAYVGRLLPRKDIRNVVRALGRFNQGKSAADRAHLLIVGGETPEPDPEKTPEIGELRQLAAEAGVGDRVHFLGKRERDALRHYYSAADVAVTTPWYEPFGLTPLEGMACGRPVIGSRVGGIQFTVADGETGLLVPPRDSEALAQALQELLQQPDKRREMGKAARSRIEREFTWRITVGRTAELYEGLLKLRAAERPLSTSGATSSTRQVARSGASHGAA